MSALGSGKHMLASWVLRILMDTIKLFPHIFSPTLFPDSTSSRGNKSTLRRVLTHLLGAQRTLKCGHHGKRAEKKDTSPAVCRRRSREESSDHTLENALQVVPWAGGIDTEAAKLKHYKKTRFDEFMEDWFRMGCKGKQGALGNMTNLPS